MSRYLIQSTQTGETYASDGGFASGPLRQEDTYAPLADYALDDEAPDWVAAREGRILRDEETEASRGQAERGRKGGKASGIKHGRGI